MVAMVMVVMVIMVVMVVMVVMLVMLVVVNICKRPAPPDDHFQEASQAVKDPQQMWKFWPVFFHSNLIL